MLVAFKSREIEAIATPTCPSPSVQDQCEGESDQCEGESDESGVDKGKPLHA